MNDYKNYIINFCSFVIMSFIVNNILPDNKIKKYFTVGVSVVFTVILCRPVLNTDFDAVASFDMLSDDYFYDEAEENNEMITGIIIEQMIEKEFGIENKCSIVCEYSENDLNIHSIDIEVYGDCNIEIIREYIKNITGIFPEITVVKNNDG